MPGGNEAADGGVVGPGHGARGIGLVGDELRHAAQYIGAGVVPSAAGSDPVARARKMERRAYGPGLLGVRLRDRVQPGADSVGTCPVSGLANYPFR